MGISMVNKIKLSKSRYYGIMFQANLCNVWQPFVYNYADQNFGLHGRYFIASIIIAPFSYNPMADNKPPSLKQYICKPIHNLILPLAFIDWM